MVFLLWVSVCPSLKLPFIVSIPVTGLRIHLSMVQIRLPSITPIKILEPSFKAFFFAQGIRGITLCFLPKNITAWLLALSFKEHKVSGIVFLFFFFLSVRIYWVPVLHKAPDHRLKRWGRHPCCLHWQLDELQLPGFDKMPRDWEEKATQALEGRDALWKHKDKYCTLTCSFVRRWVLPEGFGKTGYRGNG